MMSTTAQLVPLADLEVGLVVRGRHLQHAGAELKIDVLIADDRNQLLLLRQFSGQRTNDVLADQMRVARILRIHRHGRIARDRFRTRGGNRQQRARAASATSHFEVIQ